MKVSGNNIKFKSWPNFYIHRPRYAGVAVQVLQQLREFDAPAMQSCKPLPCGTGSCQNRRLREQTLTRKPCHCGSIKGG